MRRRALTWLPPLAALVVWTLVVWALLPAAFAAAQGAPEGTAGGEVEAGPNATPDVRTDEAEDGRKGDETRKKEGVRDGNARARDKAKSARGESRDRAGADEGGDEAERIDTGNRANDEKNTAELALLGGIRLNDLSETRERPLFTPARHPPLPPPPPPPPPARVKAPPKPPPPPPDPPSARLVGVVVANGDRIALLQLKDRSVSRLAVGDKLDGWSLTRVGASEVEMKLKDQRSVYRMFMSENEAATAQHKQKRRKRRR